MPQLRIAICRIFHGSNSFSSIETGMSHFENVGGVVIGDDILKGRGRRDEVTGFLKAIKESPEDVEIIPLISVFGLAGGNISAEAVRFLEKILREGLREAGRLDGILFAFEGAMASADIPDLDTHFLRIARAEAGETVPFVCALNCHAILTRQMVDLSSAIVAYRTHPHEDVVETGWRAGDILLRILTGKINPVMEWQKIPMILPMPDGGNRTGPLRGLFNHLKMFDEIDGVIDSSLFFSHAHVDAPEQGWSVLVITEADRQLGRRLVRELATEIWNTRRNLLPEKMVSPDQAVELAASTPGRPIVITDSADTVGAGAPGDTTTLLGALLDKRQTVDGLILFHLPDEEAVRSIGASDVGSRVTLKVGGKRDTRFSKLLEVSGEVICATDGIIEDDGKFGTTPLVDAGRTVCLGIDNVRLVLTERVVFGPQPSLFRKVGIEPFQAKIVALKTGIGFKVTYSKARGVIRADCPGAASYNLAAYCWANIQRPIFPLDPEMRWQPG